MFITCIRIRSSTVTCTWMEYVPILRVVYALFGSTTQVWRSFGVVDRVPSFVAVILIAARYILLCIYVRALYKLTN